MIVKLSKILYVEMRDLLGSVVVLLSQWFVFQVVIETVDGRQSSLVEFGSVGHVGVRVYTFRKTKSWSPKYLTVSTKFSFPLLSSSDTSSSKGRGQELVRV